MRDFPVFFKLWFAFCFLMSITMLGFIGWVVVKVMQHFGVI
jgi:hypothetical protein